MRLTLLPLLLVLSSPAVLFAHGGIDDGHITPTPVPTPPPVPVITVTGGPRHVTTAARYVLRGTVTPAGGGQKILVRVGGRSRAATLTGERWKVTLRLERRRTTVTIQAVTDQATSSRLLNLTILKKSP